jgi:hypothetical protein
MSRYLLDGVADDLDGLGRGVPLYSRRGGSGQQALTNCIIPGCTRDYLHMGEILQAQFALMLS